MEYDKNIGKWIIDTDPGCDDSFAILFGLHFLKDNLLALSITEGNSKLEQCYQNAKKICAVSNRFVPVYKGCELGMSNKKYYFEDFTAFHGEDGLFNLESFYGFENRYNHEHIEKETNENFPASDNHSALKIIELCYKYEKINLLTIGRGTNLALAFMLDPSIVNKVNRVVVMGGSFRFSGNSSAGAEFNFFADPIAAKIVTDNFKNVLIYPWEPCEMHKFTSEVLDHCIHDNHVNSFCKQMLIKKMNSLEEGIFADYGAALCAFYPQIIKSSMHVYVDVVIDGAEDIFGAMIASGKTNMSYHKLKSRKCEVVKELDYNLFVEFFKLMISNN